MKKNIKLSLFTVVCMSSVLFAGGDIGVPIDAEIPQQVVENENYDFYVGLGISTVSSRESTTSLNFAQTEDGQDRLGNITLLAGYNFHENLVFEGRYTSTVAFKDSAKMNGFSIFAKPQYAINDKFSVYGLVGYGTVTIDNTVQRSNIDVDDNGFQWGLGATIVVNDNISMFIDYTSLANDMDGTYLTANGADVDAITVGATYSF